MDVGTQLWRRPPTPARHTQARSIAYGRRRHMAERKPIESWLTDMDGVLIHEGVPIPGADAFIKKLRESGKPCCRYRICRT